MKVSAHILGGVILFLGISASAVEVETTWRQGDIVPIQIFCPLRENAITLAKAIEDVDEAEVARVHTSGLCITNLQFFGVARLSEWDSRYIWDDMVVSIWQIENPGGLMAWTVIPDDAGPHVSELAI